MRTVYECGWNLFVRRGFADAPEDIRVNYRYLDHLHEAGINWLIVFWTNSAGFREAWREAARYARSLGIRLAKGVYGYSGGGSMYRMAEPDAPEHLLRRSPKGEGTALCPFEEEARVWMHGLLPDRLEPQLDGIMFEPAREISRQCICERCRSLTPNEWDVKVLNDLIGQVVRLNPETRVMPYLFIPGGREDKLRLAQDLRELHPAVKHVFAWGMDSESSLIDWLEADPRFFPYTKIGRIILFPDGKAPARSAAERVATLFEWCRLAADRGKTAYMFDYRVFGGREWAGHEEDEPATRLSDRIPASLAIAGAAMNDPDMTRTEQHALLERLRETADWDLDDPGYFYRGERGLPAAGALG